MAAIRGSKVGITAAAMCAALMAILDISIVNVALSDIRASFGTPLDQIAWVSTGYMMANVVVIPMTGWFQRRFGFRRYFTTSILIFIAASALCGIAWNLPALVAFRVLQGLGGGAIIPTSQALLFARYPREEHGMAGALFGIGSMTGPLLGPTVGGYLIEISSWNWIFLINVPFGIIAAYLAYRHIDEPNFTAPKLRIDRLGIGMLTIGMASLQYALEEGNREGWTEPKILAAIAVASVMLITFVVHELETEDPVVDLRIFASSAYRAATGINFLLGTVLFSGGFMLSLYLGTVLHYRAMDIGALFFKGSVIQLFLMPIVGRTFGMMDGRWMIGFGLSLQVVSLLLNSGLTSQSPEGALILPIFVRAVGLCFIFVPLSVAALSDLPGNRRGGAAGLFNLTRELGGSIGTALMSTLLTRRLAENVAVLTAKVSIFDPWPRAFLSAVEDRIGVGPSGAVAALAGRINQEAMVRAFNANYRLLALIFALSLLLVLRLGGGRGDAAAGAAAH